jgi:membrane protease YdiL (CAAX protease family)
VTLAPPRPGPAPAPPAPARRGRPLLAWLVILGAVAFLLVRYWRTPPSNDRAVRLVTVLVQARYLVGLGDLGLPGAPPQELYRQGRGLLARGPFDQRLRAAVVAGEMAGPREALSELRRLDQDWAEGKASAPEGGPELAALLVRLYTGYEDGPPCPVLTGAEQEQVRSQLDWFGELALAPPGGPDPEARQRVLATARRAAEAQVGGLALTFGGAFVGGLLLLLALILLYHGSLRGGLSPSGNGGIYVEAFAAYLVLFQALGYGARWLPAGNARLLLSALVMLASLAALAWPVLRGVPWAEVRRDLGLFAGRRPGREPLLGLVSYVAALPLVLAALLVTFGLMRLFRQLGWPVSPLGPSHPVVGLALRADVWTWLQLAFLACVAAPIIEEVMFRGLLYRHLREATGRAHPAASVLLSAVASSFVFAALHPQGVLGIPVLMALAVAFALAREWRETLVPPMVAHGLNNGAVLLVLMLSTL